MCYRLTLNRSQIIFFDFFSKYHFSDTDYFKFIFFVFCGVPFCIGFLAFIIFQFYFFISDQFMVVKLSLQAGCIVLV